ncbi:uncharacterized protein COLE_07535 [Cutaneotrichosporon oleaginosum]|uniref:uncharacterized protein n=1 Tax=Cutaneotrichosporon oleaginosum TaxID=879819 RepID=UPI00132284E8|nr:hypothetical protein COLE_07535 [Cutaneotrichosporon oleaginosum]
MPVPSLEKGEVDHREFDESRDDWHGDIDHGFDPAFVKHTRRKIDWRLIPVLGAVYSISLIDRNNLSFARAANNLQMMKDLQMTTANNGYGEFSISGIASLVFFIPYILLEVPSQMGLRKYGVRHWLGAAVVAWGIVTIGMGFVKNRHGLAGLRALLGVFEAVLFPGGSFLISCWYPRHEMAQRMSWFYSTSIAVTGFAAILSWCMSHLDLKGGLRGWSWIFVIWGLVTVVVGAVAWVFLVDFPDKATFITEEQRHWVKTRINRDRGDAVADKITWPKFFRYAGDLKIWLFAYIFMGTTLGAYQIAFFLPAILASMGFTNMEIQLLVCPVYVWAVVPAMISARLSDRFRVRGPVLLANNVCLVIGATIFWKLPLTQKGARLFGVFLAFGGITALIPMIVSWSQTSVRRQSKRGFSSALVVAFGGVGGILASVAFMEREAKAGYPTGMTLSIALQSSNVVGILGLMAWFKYQNGRADRGVVVLEESESFRYQL